MDLISKIPTSWKNQVLTVWSEAKLLDWAKKMELLLGDNTTPATKNLFKALEICDFEKVKVVILGQDPYPTVGHANGMAFSTEDHVQPFPKSLLNIFKELKNSIPGYDFPLTGNLTPWAHQGVLLLNTVLTTEVGVVNAHRNRGWEEFTDVLIQLLFEKRINLVGMFWGKQAHEAIANINEEGHLFLKTSHPSPLSSYRGFNGCEHFKLCNEFLTTKGQKAIDWQT